jgi:bifunctional UDP-N-acetylglucosamine pyrophosphorylase/glucosamine-1-phosphate N-acetyltransferase
VSGVSAPTVVILAAGQGTRMRSRVPKVLHEICGRPIVEWVVTAARDSGAGRVVVVGGPDRALAGHLPDGVELAVQAEARGTGDAVLAAAEHIDSATTVVVISGDVPLITAQAISELAGAHAAEGAAATMATMVLADPTGYGRVIRAPDGGVERVVETKSPGDATEHELSICEVNAGVYAFQGGALIDALGRVGSDNAQGEYYLPDALVVLREAGESIAAHTIEDPTLMLGINDRADLATVRAVAQQRIHLAHMRAGVTIVDPASTVIDVGVQIAPDATIEPSSFLHGDTSVAAGARIGPLSSLTDVTVEAEASVVQSHLVSCRVGARASVGPFSYLRPDAVLGEGAKAGTFVEIKNSNIGADAKIPHLSYIGDADVGEASNLGAGTITANYDGARKHRTTIGRRVRGGVDTSLVAPVTVGDDAYTAAGSVITEDVPPGALGVARARQENREGYAQRRQAGGGGGPEEGRQGGRGEGSQGGRGEGHRAGREAE